MFIWLGRTRCARRRAYEALSAMSQLAGLQINFTYIKHGDAMDISIEGCFKPGALLTMLYNPLDGSFMEANFENVTKLLHRYTYNNGMFKCFCTL